MKFTSTISASVAALVVSSVTVEAAAGDGAVLAAISTMITDLMYGAGVDYCSATAGDITTVNSTMPLCLGEYSAGVAAAAETYSVCFPAEQNNNTRRLDGDDVATGALASVFSKGLELALAGGELDAQILKLLRNDMMPALFNDVLSGCVLNATHPTVVTIGGMLFKGSAFTDDDYKSLKSIFETLNASGRRLDDPVTVAIAASVFGKCMTGGPNNGPRMAYGLPGSFFTFLSKIENENTNPTSCEVCDMLATVPMSTENALDAAVISFLVDNRDDVTKFMRDLSGIVTTLLRLTVKEGSMRSSVCNADKTSNLEVVGFGLSSECITSAVAFESTAWSMLSDVVVSGLPDNCDNFVNYLCGAAEPVLPMYSVNTMGAKAHAAFADMFINFPAETTTMASFLKDIEKICATDGEPGAASSTTLSLMAMISSLAVVAFVN